MNQTVHPKRSLIFIVFLLFSVVAAAGCSTRIKSEWKDNSFQGGRPQKVLVIGVAKSATVRRFFETECVRRFKAHGINAVESFPFLSDEATDASAGRDLLVAKIKELGITVVLMSRSLGARTETATMPGVTIYSAPFGSYGGWSSYYGLAYAYPYTYTSGTSWDRGMYVTMESQLFDVKTEKLIWSIQSETAVSGIPEEEIRPYVGMIMKKLFRANLFK